MLGIFLCIQVLLMLPWIDGFITPSENEPVCPSVKCLNGGILDVNTCTCDCPSTFTGWTCEDNNTISAWPLGKYALPTSIHGCPEEDWKIYYINISLPQSVGRFTWNVSEPFSMSNITMSIHRLHILGPYSDRNLQLNFCVRDDSVSTIGSDLQGNFCIFSVDNECSKGFNMGTLSIEGYNTEYRGFLPTNDTSKLELIFCCREDANSTLSQTLPLTYPFILLKGHSTERCEDINGIDVTENVIYFPKDGVSVEFSGTLPHMIHSDSYIGLEFCIYNYKMTYANIRSDKYDYHFDGQISKWIHPNMPDEYFWNYRYRPLNVFAGELYDKGWVQACLQETVYVKQIIIGLIMFKESDQGIVEVHAHSDQWSIVNGGAEVCSIIFVFHMSSNIQVVCQRPVKGRYVSLIVGDTYALYSIGIYIHSKSTGCGRRLGMISGDISDFQIDTSNASIPYRLTGGEVRCLANNDEKEKWIMVDLIVPTVVEGLEIIWTDEADLEFILENGIKKSNMTVYKEAKIRPEIFRLERKVQGSDFTLVWLMRTIMTRFLKLSWSQRLCLIMEVVGCPVFGTRTMRCKADNNIFDLGFATTPQMSLDIESFKQQFKVENITLENSSQESCNQLTLEKGYHGNSLKELDCFLFNISRNNRHFSYAWTSRTNYRNTVSERLCYTDFLRYNGDAIQEEYKLNSGETRDIYSPFYASSNGRGIRSITTITGLNGTYIRITVLYVSLTVHATKQQLLKAGYHDTVPSRCNDTIQLKIGKGSNVNITAANQERYRYATFIASNHTVVITFTSCFRYLMASRYTYQFKIETTDSPGCGIDGTRFKNCWNKVGLIASYLYPSFYTRSDANTLQIEGRIGQYIELTVIDLNIRIEDKIDSFIEIFDISLGATKSSFGRLYMKGIESTHYKSSWHMMDIEFRAGNELTGRGFFGRYTIIDAVSNMNQYVSSEDCRTGWKGFRKSCYKIFTNSSLNKEQRDDLCVKYGGHLVSISSKEEMKFVHGLIIYMIPSERIQHTSITDGIFIGLTKKKKGYWFTDYIWENGEPLLYNSWYDGKPSQPDGFGHEHCTAIILKNIHNIRNWHDVPCAVNNIHHMLCEKPMNLSHNKVNSEDTYYIELSGNSSSPRLLNVYQCDNGEYVSKFNVCNGVFDCVDQSDEVNCEIGCSDSQYKCRNGECIHLMYHCDGKEDCGDSSDEIDCEWNNCKLNEWECGSGQCIPMESRCDIKKDCFDGSDELTCESCSPAIEQCFDLSCISKERICDKISDCLGVYREDEEDKCTPSQIMSSCEELWNVGHRSNGTYTIRVDSYDVSVYCEYIGLADHINISTYIYPREENHRFYSYSTKWWSSSLSVGGQLIRSYHDANTCSQHVKASCYFHRFDLFYSINNIDCLNSSIDWSQQPVNDIVTSSTELRGHNIAQRYKTVYRINTDSDEAFVDIQFGPVICTAELPRSATLVCDNGQVYDARHRCLLDMNEYGDIKYCRDMSHLQQCEDFPCPSEYFKCAEGHCVPPRFVCDGNKHCIDGDDEINCENMTCKGLYRCHRSTTCLSLDAICDGVLHCPRGDDEVACNITCPDNCSCNGAVFTCRHDEIGVVLSQMPRSTRKLNLAFSRFDNSTSFFDDFPHLAELILANCSLEHINNMTFYLLSNLIVLDLSYNKLVTLYRNVFFGLNRLKTLNLKGNYFLETLEAGTFLSLSNVKSLEIVGTKISRLKAGTFKGLDKLQYLNISRNEITIVEKDCFSGLNNLIDLNISFNNIETFDPDMFGTLKNLNKLFTDSYIFCCIKPLLVKDENCEPKQDAFSSCSDLMKNELLRICLWIIGIMALTGNIGVILYRVMIERKLLSKPHIIFVFNLSVSDLMTGIYLSIIAIADLLYKNEYILHEKKWRQSGPCTMAGILATISSEASVNFILLITIDRLFAVKFPFGDIKITKKIAIATTFVTWIAVMLLGILPVVFVDYFSASFYTNTGLCLALPFAPAQLEGWEFSSAIFVFYNMVIFIVIAVCQCVIYQTAKSTSRIIPAKSQRDLQMAKKLFLVVITDFLCWMPIGVMGVISMSGYLLPLDVYAWVAVFVIPVNAALNPFLYTFNNIKKKSVNKSVQFQNNKGKQKIDPKMVKLNKKRRKRDPDVELLVDYFSARDHLLLTCAKLTEVLKTRKLKPREIYVVLTQTTKAVAYLHKHNLTPCEHISGNVLVLLMDKMRIVKIKLDLRTQDIVNEEDVSNDVEDIGKLAKVLLRNAHNVE